MDALSSQATIAGYKAVLVAAEHLTRLLPMMTTAAGTLPPARVLVLGAGVAGPAGARHRAPPRRADDRLRRPARDRRAGALGRRRLARPRHRGRGRGRLRARPHRRRARRPAGRVDGGDRRLRRRDHDGAGPGAPGAAAGQRRGRRGHASRQRDRRSRRRDGQLRAVRARARRRSTTASRSSRRPNLPARVPEHASQLYARNVLALLELLLDEGELRVDLADEILAAACVSRARRSRRRVT